jgi:diguanylate cyclase (GGDEF)-like protein
MVENDLRLRAATALDSLTSIFNRRHLIETIRTQWAAPESATLGAVIADVDWFKAYNDTYGHQAGDDCLRAIAAEVQSVAKSHGLIAGRLGGEEFGLLCADTDPARLQDALEQLRANVEAQALQHQASPFGRVTLSIGASLTRKAPGPGDHRASFATADQALYAAKAAGRNCVILRRHEASLQ